MPADVQKYMEEIKFGQLWARHSLIVNRLDVGKYRIDMIGLRGAVAEVLGYVVADKAQPGPRWVRCTDRLPGYKLGVRWRDGNDHYNVTKGKISLYEMDKANLEGWEWYDEQPAADSKSEPKWVKGALQWAKETIDFAWDYVKVPESLGETWGNMYMNTMHAIQQAQQEIEQPAAGREEVAVEFAEWMYQNRWFQFENGKWYYTFEQGTSMSDKQYQKEYVKTTAELYQLFKQQKEK